MEEDINGLIVDDEIEDDITTEEYDIATYPSDYTVSVLYDMWENDDIEIPDYQRKYVWTIKQASLLIDSILTGLPIPPLFFYIDDQNKNLVIDGQQRLLSTIFFISGLFGEEDSGGKKRVFRLYGLSDASPYQNMRFEDLDDSDQRKVKQAVLRVINIRQLKPEGDSSCAFHIFERLNTGGTALSPQEIRNVVFRGEFNQQLIEANKNLDWRIILGQKDLDKRQKDVELVLRLFSLVNNISNYEKPMKNFLNDEMKINRRGNSKRIKEFFRNFELAASLVANKLGEKPFHLRGPLNVSALDSIMSVIIENIDKNEFENLENNFLRLKNNDIFKESTTSNTTDTKTVLARIEVVKSHILVD